MKNKMSSFFNAAMKIVFTRRREKKKSRVGGKDFHPGTVYTNPLSFCIVRLYHDFIMGSHMREHLPTNPINNIKSD